MPDEPTPDAFSLDGQPIYVHTESTPFAPPQGEMCLAQISAHIEQHLGAVETVFHEIVSDTVHIDVHVVLPNADCPHVRLVTSGMSDLPMDVPEEFDAPRCLELMITLPGDWRLAREDFEDERWYWPIRLIKELARLPHKYRTWLGEGHSIPNGDPAEPYAEGTALNGAILLASPSVPPEFGELRIDDEKVISFLSVIPVYEEEMNLKLREGVGALLQRFDAQDLDDTVNVTRPNVAQRKKRFGLF